jgi:amino acid adenylation domain-containing protein
LTFLLHRALAEGASRHPAAAALRFRGATITYGELARRADRVRDALAQLGAVPGDRVLIQLPKSPASVAAVFGALAAGCVYVPVDARTPPARLEQLARDSEALAWIGGAGDPGQPGLARVELAESGELAESTDLASPAATPTVAAAGAPGPEPIDADLAAILYTSGSSGRPKGVMLSHRNILHFVEWARDCFGLGPADRVTSHAPIHFDLSTFDLFATLAAGGTVVLVPDEAHALPSQMLELLAAEAVTVTYMVPSSLTLLALWGGLGERPLPDLRLVLFAGEVLPVKVFCQWRDAVPHARFFNLYGPTETNVCTFYEVPRAGLTLDSPPPPIGAACANTGVFVLDDEGRPVLHSGGEGELWVRGAGVARGYWHNPEATRERFRCHPLRPDSGEVVYRTGDLVTLDADGLSWRFLGRTDQMVKIRGHRIEPGEIEACLHQHPAVAEAVVLAEGEDLDRTMVAYVAPAAGATLDTREVLAHCRARLPRYMVPDRLEVRAALPKTATGKLDRRSLRNLAGPLPSQGRHAVNDPHQIQPYEYVVGDALSATVELGLNFAALLGPAYLLWACRTGPLALVLLLALTCYYAAVVVFLALVVLFWRLALADRREGRFIVRGARARRYMLAARLMSIVERSPFRAPIYELAPLRFLFLRGMGAAVDGTFVMTSHSQLADPWFFKAGKNCVLGVGAVVTAHYVQQNVVTLERVELGDNVTIGARAMISPGVRIGNNVIVGAAAVVPRRTVIPDGEFWAGNPATRIDPFAGLALQADPAGLASVTAQAGATDAAEREAP